MASPPWTLRPLTWNLYHGRDFPPDPALRTWRSRLFRRSERNETHRQVNRCLFEEFAGLLAGAEWDVALLQECPPRWTARLAARCRADLHRSLTSRNSLAPVRATLARLNPDLIASAEGGSNAILVRHQPISERREIAIASRPERRTMAFARLGSGLCVACVHASNVAAAQASEEVLAAAEQAADWAGDSPLLFGGDLNVRPATEPETFAELERRFDLAPPTGPDAIDHLLARGLEAVAPPRRWLPEWREVTDDGFAIRLSDHAPVEAVFVPRGRVYSEARQ